MIFGVIVGVGPSSWSVVDIRLDKVRYGIIVGHFGQGFSGQMDF